MITGHKVNALCNLKLKNYSSNLNVKKNMQLKLI